MKKIKFLISNLLLVMMCFMFAACPPDPEPNEVVKLDLIGVWKYCHSGGYDLYQFNNDGTGSGIESDGYYWNFEYDLNAETLRLVYAKENESAEIWNIDVISNSSIEINNEMVLTRTTEKVERYKAVDLGLSVKWAACNVGASRAEDYGDYFAWGETEPKTFYSWDTYLYGHFEGGVGVTKYYSITIPEEIVGTKYDVAHVKWGGKWRMPTVSEANELVTRCKKEWIVYNGVNGLKITGPNGKYIFLPAAGANRSGEWGDDDFNIDSQGCMGTYWISSHCGTDSIGRAREIDFLYSDYVRELNITGWYAHGGNSVRPVTE